jgi:hydrogenase nickel incorporation protein HypB
MFHHADLVVISKIDLVPHLGTDMAALLGNLERVMPDPRVIELSARSGDGMDEWIAWLQRCRTAAPPTADGRVLPSAASIP